jgi:hypothetical protein
VVPVVSAWRYQYIVTQLANKNGQKNASPISDLFETSVAAVLLKMCTEFLTNRCSEMILTAQWYGWD